MENENTKIVEINGVKMQIDLREAKIIEHYRVGDNVRVLVKGYGDKYEVYAGVITEFTDFEKMPTITVCYLKVSYSGVELEFVNINESTEDIELAPTAKLDELRFKKSDVMAKFQDEITKKEEEIKDIERKRDYFKSNFNKYFKPENQEA